MIANTRQSRESLDQCPLATRPRPSCAVLPFFCSLAEPLRTHAENSTFPMKHILNKFIRKPSRRAKIKFGG